MAASALADPSQGSDGMGSGMSSGMGSGMMDGYGGGWMGGYGGIWVLILLVIVVAGLVAWSSSKSGSERIVVSITPRL